jgi:hypothetical protein
MTQTSYWCKVTTIAKFLPLKSSYISKFLLVQNFFSCIVSIRSKFQKCLRSYWFKVITFSKFCRLGQVRLVEMINEVGVAVRVG